MTLPVYALGRQTIFLIRELGRIAIFFVRGFLLIFFVSATDIQNN